MVNDKINLALSSALLHGNIAAIAFRKIADSAGDPQIEEAFSLLAIHTSQTSVLLRLLVDHHESQGHLPKPDLRTRWERFLDWIR